MHGTILILAILLGVLSIILLVKNFLIELNTSDNTLINIIIVALLLIPLVCAFAAIFGEQMITDIISEIGTLKEGVDDVNINLMRLQINERTKEIVIYTIAGYVSLILSYIFLNTVKRKKKETCNKTSNWDWNKVDK